MQLQQLPYVKGLPDDGQQSITFVRNGDKLMGATTKRGHDGILNAASSELQENIVVLELNINKLNEAGMSSDVEIEKIKEILAQSGSTDLITQVKENTEAIESLTAENVVNVDDIKALKLANTDIRTEIGVKPPEAVNRDIYSDLTFVKTRIGNEDGFDINGIPSVDLPASGLIKKVQDINTQAVKNRNDIVELRGIVEGADVDEMGKQIDELRLEIGPVAVVDEKPIKTRLDEAEVKLGNNTRNLVEINASIGMGTIVVVDEIAAMKEDHKDLDKLINDPTTGLVVEINKNKTTIGDSNSGLVKQTADNKTAIAALEKSVKDPATGLTKKVDDLNAFTGIGQADPTQDSLAGKVKVLTALSNDNASTLQDIQVEVGNANSGLIGDVAAIKVVQADHKTRIETLETKVGKLELDYSQLGNKVGDLLDDYNDLSTKYSDLNDKYTALELRVKALEP